MIRTGLLGQSAVCACAVAPELSAIPIATKLRANTPATPVWPFVSIKSGCLVIFFTLVSCTCIVSRGIVHEVTPLGSAILALLALTPKLPNAAAPRSNANASTSERKRLAYNCRCGFINLDACRAIEAAVAPRAITRDVWHCSLGCGGGV